MTTCFRLFSVAAGLVLGAAAATAADEPVAVIINGDPVPLSQIEREYQALPRQYRNVPFERVYPSLVNRHVDRRLLLDAGLERNLIDDPEVQDLIADYADQAVQQVYLARRVKEFVTEDAVQIRYEAYLAENPPVEQVRLRHIILDTRDEALDVIERLRAGADFADLARQRSTGPSAPQGGDIGYFSRAEIIDEFRDVVFQMQPGDITSEPVQTGFGHHVIRVEDRRTLTPQSLEEKRQGILNDLSQEAVRTILDGLRATAEIQRFELDGSPVDSDVEKPETGFDLPGPDVQ